MNIKISDAGLDYLERKQHNVITLEIEITGGGCCPTYEVEDIYFKQPDHLDKFNVSEFNGITLYIDKNVKVITPVLQFDVEKTLIFEKMIVKGLGLKKQE